MTLRQRFCWHSWTVDWFTSPRTRAYGFQQYRWICVRCSLARWYDLHRPPGWGWWT